MPGLSSISRCCTFFGASDAIYPYARDYIMIYLCGSIFVMIALGMNPFINSQGFARVGMLTVLLGALANIALDRCSSLCWAGASGERPLPPSFPSSFSAVWVVGFLRGRNAGAEAAAGRIPSGSPAGEKNPQPGNGGGLSCPAPIPWFRQPAIPCCIPLAETCISGVMTVVNSIREIAQTPAQAMGDGASPVMSYNYGEGQCRKVKRGIWFMTLLTVIYLAAMWLILFLFPRLFISIFNRDPELVEDGGALPASVFLRLFYDGLPDRGAERVLNPWEKPGRLFFFSLFRKIIIVVPLTFILPRVAGLGVMGVFLAESPSPILSAEPPVLSPCAPPFCRNLELTMVEPCSIMSSN